MLCYGDPDWIRGSMFSIQAGRLEHHDEFDAHIETFTRMYDKFKLSHILQKEGAPAGPVLTEEETYHAPHLNARGFFKVIHQADTGSYRYPGFLWDMCETPPDCRLPPPMMGEHNAYVFKEIPGLSDTEITELTEKKIIGGDRYV
jgi:crotonobetainyl-CoA:carnitine CoA-transferase CaiB-like acyl-CoA transferase